MIRSLIILFILYRIETTAQLIREPNSHVLSVPQGLFNGEIIQWIGQSYSHTNESWLQFKSHIDSEPFFQMKLQHFENQISIYESFYGIMEECYIGDNIITSEKQFNVQLLITFIDYKIYINNVLKYTVKSTYFPTEIKYVVVGGSGNLTSLNKLTDEDFSHYLSHNQCGITTAQPLSDALSELCYNQTLNSSESFHEGFISTPGSNPWQAAIRYKPRYVNDDFPHKCGAILINECWAISAAHCLPVTHPGAIRRLVLRVGDYFNYDTDTEVKEKFSAFQDLQDLEIEEVYKHERFIGLANDIALIKLKTCARLGPFVKPICFPKSPNQFKSGETCVVSGWGAFKWREVKAKYPKCLIQKRVELLSSLKCKQKLSNQLFLNELMLCAVGKNGEDTCQGDSGGPFVCGYNKSFLFGVTSWGIDCGRPQFPGVYTRISAYLKWIYTKILLHPNDKEMKKMIARSIIPRELCQAI